MYDRLYPCWLDTSLDCPYYHASSPSLYVISESEMKYTVQEELTFSQRRGSVYKCSYIPRLPLATTLSSQCRQISVGQEPSLLPWDVDISSICITSTSTMSGSQPSSTKSLEESKAQQPPYHISLKISIFELHHIYIRWKSGFEQYGFHTISAPDLFF